VDLFGAKPFTVQTLQSPSTIPNPSVNSIDGDVFGMPVFSPSSPHSTSDQDMIVMQVLEHIHYCTVRSTFSSSNFLIL